MMKIAMLSVHTSPISPPTEYKVGGMNTYVREITHELALRGYQIDIFTRRINPESLNVILLNSQVKVVNIHAGPSSLLPPDSIFPYLQEFTSGMIAYAIRENVAYDWIFSHYWLSGWVARHLKSTWGIPFVQIFHTLGHTKSQISPASISETTLRTHMEAKVTSSADLVLTNTPAERDHLVQFYQATPHKVLVHPPGVNTDRFYPVHPIDARKQLNLPLNQSLLLYAGRIEPLKGIDMIINALKILSDTSPEITRDLCLLIIGGDPHPLSNPYMLNLKKLSRRLSLMHQIEFIGAKDQQTLAIYYSAATTVIIPSEYESFGMVALEAIACGTPIIASSVGGMIELIQHYQVGLLMSERSPRILAHRIQEMITDDHLRNTMIQNTFAISNQYTWPKVVDVLLQTLQNIIVGTQLNYTNHCS